MTTAVIVQARMGSTRLPGKVLFELAGKTVLAQVLTRCGAIPTVDVVCCAVPKDAESDPVADEARACGVEVFRGSEADVLDRYYGAARMLGATIIMRVTGDCPLIDPNVCDRVLELQRVSAADHACNNMPPTWPHGLDCESFTFEALARAWSHAKTPYQREHVTPWLRTYDDIRRVNLKRPGGRAMEQRWTLDFPEDYAVLSALFVQCPAAALGATNSEISAFLDANPEITALNAARREARRRSHPDGALKSA